MKIARTRNHKVMSKCHKTLTNKKYLTRPNFGISAFLTRKFELNLIIN